MIKKGNIVSLTCELKTRNHGISTVGTQLIVLHVHSKLNKAVCNDIEGRRKWVDLSSLRFESETASQEWDHSLTCDLVPVIVVYKGLTKGKRAHIVHKIDRGGPSKTTVTVPISVTEIESGNPPVPGTVCTIMIRAWYAILHGFISNEHSE